MLETRCPECGAVADHEVIAEEFDGRSLTVRCSTEGCGAVFIDALLTDA